MNKTKAVKLLQTKKDLWIPLLGFLILCLIKALIVLPMADGPVSFGDELGYRNYSYQWFHYGTQQGSPHYPMVYPIAMMASFLMKDWYMAMKVLNILYSSLTIIFLYLIARLYLDEKKSALFMIVGATIPFQFTFPAMILSENVFFPLLLLVIYITLYPFKQKSGYDEAGYAKVQVSWFVTDILLGVCICALCLTRFIAIVTVPVFALVWFMKMWDQKVRFRYILLRGSLIVITIVVCYLPWYLIWCDKFPFKEIIGFGITSKTNPEQLTMKRLILSAAFYIAYYILLASPMILWLVYSLISVELKKLCGAYNRLWIMVYGIMGAFFVAVTRHSWRASYNYPTYYRIMGRYLIIFPILFILLALVTREKWTTNHKEKTILGAVIAAMISGISFGAVVFSYLLDIKGTFYPLSDKFLSWKGAVDGYKMGVIGTKWLVGIGIAMLIIWALDFVDFKKLQKNGVAVIVVMLVLLQLWGMKDYYAYIYEVRASRAFASIREMNEIFMDTEVIQTELVYDLSQKVDKSWENKYLKFFGNNEKLTIVALDEVSADVYYVVCDATTIGKYDGHIMEEVGRFIRLDNENIILKVNGAN